MKCTFVIDVDVDVAVLDVTARKSIQWRPVRDAKTGKTKLEAYFPAGTEYAHPNAAYFVNRGMAVPADDECEAACPGLTPEMRQKLEQEYAADQRGIVDKDDRELFFAGVIDGYEQVQGRTAYIPGPNYASWKQAQDALKTAAPSDI